MGYSSVEAKGLQRFISPLLACRPNKIDLLMFQFNKWGGGFRIGISYVLQEGKHRNLSSAVYDAVPPQELTVGHTSIRHQLFPKRYNGWFYYYDIIQIGSGRNEIQMAVSPAEKKLYIDS